MKKVICKYCGSEAIADTSIVLTSYPPQYNVDCPKCGRVYMFCNEVNSVEDNDFLTNEEIERVLKLVKEYSKLNIPEQQRVNMFDYIKKNWNG
jgi:uncharacterized Zn finger protein